MGEFLAWMLIGCIIFLVMPVIVVSSIALCVQLIGFPGVIVGLILGFAITAQIITWLSKNG
jgi:hypothetical protein